MKINFHTKIAWAISAGAALSLWMLILGSFVPAHADDPWSLPILPIAETTLDNGLRVINVPFRPHLPVVRVQLIVKAGAVDDPAGKEGLAALTAAVMGRGTASRTADQIAGFFETAGGGFAPSVSMTSSSFTFALLKKDLDAGLEILSDLVLNPVFPEEELLFHKYQLMVGVQGELDDPGSLSRLHLNRLAYGPAHRAGRRTTEASLEAISREDLIAFHRTYFTPGSAVLVFAGSVAPEEAFAAAEKWLGGWSPKERPPAPHQGDPATSGGPRVRLVEKPGMTEVHMAVAFHALTEDDPRRTALALAEYLLTGNWVSRLFRALRGERGLVYFIDGGLDGWTFPGNLWIHTASANETWEEAFGVLVEELRRFQEGVSDEELEQAKAHEAGSFPLAISTTAGLAELIAAGAVRGVDPVESLAYVERVRSVTLEEVNGVISDVVDFQRAAVVLVGDPAALDGAEATVRQILGDLAGELILERVDWTSVDR